MCPWGNKKMNDFVGGPLLVESLRHGSLVPLDWRKRMIGDKLQK